MGYKLYNDETLVHSLKGTAWKNHKYISKIWKNGKWIYNYGKGSGDGHTLKDYNEEYKKTNEYTKIEKDKKTGQYKQVNYTEYTRNGKNWLNSSIRIQNGNDVKIYKEKGKISQAVEKSAAKGRSFIQKLSKKKKK